MIIGAVGAVTMIVAMPAGQGQVRTDQTPSVGAAASTPIDRSDPKSYVQCTKHVDANGLKHPRTGHPAGLESLTSEQWNTALGTGLAGSESASTPYSLDGSENECQARIAIHGVSGPHLQLEPETNFATVLLTGRASSLDSALRGAITDVIRTSGTPSISGIGLASDRPGFIANTTITELQHRSSPTAAFDDVLEIATDEADSAYGVAHPDGWVQLNYEPSLALWLLAYRPLAGRASDKENRAYYTWGLMVLRHELEHTVTPRINEPQWIEEGSVQTLTEWPGTIEQMSRAMGFSFRTTTVAAAMDDNPGYATYADESESVRIFLRMAGINTADPRDRVKAVALLQHPPRTPELALVTAIAHERHLTRDQIQLLRVSLDHFDGDPTAARALDRATRGD